MRGDEEGLLVLEQTCWENEIQHQSEMLRSASEVAVMKTVNEEEDLHRACQCFMEMILLARLFFILYKCIFVVLNIFTTVYPLILCMNIVFL